MDVISHRGLWKLWTTCREPGPTCPSVGPHGGTMVDNPRILWTTRLPAVEIEAD